MLFDLPCFLSSSHLMTYVRCSFVSLFVLIYSVEVLISNLSVRSRLFLFGKFVNVNATKYCKRYYLTVYLSDECDILFECFSSSLLSFAIPFEVRCTFVLPRHQSVGFSTFYFASQCLSLWSCFLPTYSFFYLFRLFPTCLFVYFESFKALLRLLVRVLLL